MSRQTLAVLLVFGLLPVPLIAQVRRGSEFQVNTHTTASQDQPTVAARADGAFLVVWKDAPGGGTGQDVFGRLYDASGAALGPETRINQQTSGSQAYPAVAAISGGRFVVVWVGSGEEDGDGVFGRVVDPQGHAVGDEFAANTYTTGTQSDVAVASDEDGNFVVAWRGPGLGDPDGVFARRFDSAAAAVGGAFAVNSFTTGVQANPAVALRESGDFFVLWNGAGEFDSNGVHMQRFNAAGKFGPQFQVNGHVTGDQANPAIAAEPFGDLFLTWDSLQDGNAAGVYGRRITSNVEIGPEFRVNSYTTSVQWQPRVASDADGNFVVVWRSTGQDGSGAGAFGQRFDAGFVPTGTEFQVNSYTTGHQSELAIASDPAGNWLAVWVSPGQDGSGNGVFGQMFAPDRIFDNGFNSSATGISAWSAAQTDGTDLALSTAAAMRGAMGLRALVDDTVGLWVQDSTPLDESRYRARFYFDPNGFDPGEALNHRRIRLLIVFEENPVRRLATIVLRRLNGAYAVRGSVRLDDHRLDDSPFVPISDGPHFVELEWQRSSGPDAEDGAFSLWVDGSLVHTASGLDNSLSAVDFIRLGALTLKAGANGTLYIDEFKSRRESFIGQF